MNYLPNKELYGDKITAIIYTTIPQPVTGKQFLKYRGVDNTFNGLDRFIKFAAKFPGAAHINFYNKHSGAFIEQQKIAP